MNKWMIWGETPLFFWKHPHVNLSDHPSERSFNLTVESSNFWTAPREVQGMLGKS